MPDGAHIGAFFSGLGRTLSGHLARASEQKDAEKSAAEAEKAKQTDFIHQMLLSSAEHNPDLAVDDYHKILKTVLTEKGKRAGISEDQITNMLGALVGPAAKTFKPPAGTISAAEQNVAPGVHPELTDNPDDMSSQRPRKAADFMMPTTLGDRAAAQAGRMTEATKVPVAQANQQGRLNALNQRHANNIEEIQKRGDVKAIAAFNQRYQENLARGLDEGDARTDASTYAKALSDANLGGKQAGVKRTEAQTNLANVRADLAPKILQQRIAEANDRKAYRWQNLDRLERLTDSQIGALGMSKSDVGSIKGYMHTLDAMKTKVATDIDKARMKGEKEGKTPEEIKAITDDIFDSYTTSAQSIAQSAEQVLGDKIVIDPGGGWPSIAPRAAAPAGVGTTTSKGTGKRGSGIAPTGSSALITNDPRVGKQVRNKTTGAVGVVDGVTADGQLHVNWGAGH